MIAKSQLEQLADTWPRTYRALCQTFYPAGVPGKTTDAGQNEAGYLLAGLDRYRRVAGDLHSHKNITPAALDQAAARETFYQHHRGREFRRAAAALSACWAALPSERPEKLFAAQAKERRPHVAE